MATKLEIPYPTPVEAFLSESPLGVFIAGVWRPTKRKKTFDTVDPGSGAILARVYNGETEDVQDAVEAAQQSFARSGWARMAPKERAVYLHRLADLV